MRQSAALTGDDKAASIAPWKELPAALEQFAEIQADLTRTT
jgi:hypothetical protein